jgi:hypothetical protein
MFVTKPLTLFIIACRTLLLKTYVLHSGLLYIYYHWLNAHEIILWLRTVLFIQYTFKPLVPNTALVNVQHDAENIKYNLQSVQNIQSNGQSLKSQVFCKYKGHNFSTKGVSGLSLLRIKKILLSAHILCALYGSQNKSLASLYNINQLVFIFNIQHVYYAASTESLKIIHLNFNLLRFNDVY